MEHAINRPDVFAVGAIRGFLKAIVCGLLVLSLIAALLDVQWPSEKSPAEAPMTQAVVAPTIACAIHAGSTSSHCQQAEELSLLTDCMVSGPTVRSTPRFSILDAMARLQHRPDSPLRPPTLFSCIA